MSHYLSRFAPRLLAAVVAAAALTSGAIALAAAQGSPAPSAALPTASAAPATIRVPSIEGKAYVFAKGILEDAGFAWRVAGRVDGYAANFVARQVPAAGTRVLNNGSPTLTIYLQKNAAYAQNGAPENTSPYTGTPVKMPGAAEHAQAFRGSKLAPRTRAATPKIRAVADERQGQAPAAGRGFSGGKLPATETRDPESKTRPPAFVAKGAPKEPLDEMPLTDRARMLGRWLDANPEYTDEHVTHWLYQHAWIVEGARFGWWHGARALEVLIGLDKRVQKLWGVGSKSQSVAEAALAEVAAKSR